MAAEFQTEETRDTESGRLSGNDSFNIEAGREALHDEHTAEVDWKTTLSLAFQSLGVIYGDIGTSPLYVFSSTFPHGISNKDDILGVASLIIYTIMLIPMLKYVFIVLWANDNGEGGTFALYSLICRNAKVSLLPDHEPEDPLVSEEALSNQPERAEKIKKKLESSMIWKMMLFLVTILATSMVMGDGVLTPCISVLSAVSGIKGLHQDAVVGISVSILIILFWVQRFGTDKIGFIFAPAICLWFLFLTGIGMYNLFTHDLTVLRAFNPAYILHYFKRNGKEAWISLGGVVLCITGTEAMFADLGHFNVRAIQISFSTAVFPSIVIGYMGQAAYLSKHPDHVSNTFYKSIPGPLYWPQFVVAMAAAIIASQAMISGAFAIISQSLSVGCFPRVRVIHTSSKYEGQVYIPEVNFLLMVACVIITWSYKTSANIGNAYGIAVVAVMLITTFLLTLIMLVVWRTRIWLVVLFFVTFFGIEGVYFSSVLYKFVQGGYLPLAFALVLMAVMGIWHYVENERHLFELRSKVSPDYIKNLAKHPDIKRAPGIGLLYSPIENGIPPVFAHIVANIWSIHSVVIFVSVKPLPTSEVAPEEQFLFRRIEPREYGVYSCVFRHGYKDSIIDNADDFVGKMLENLKNYIRKENALPDQVQGHAILEEDIPAEEETAIQSINDAETASSSNQSLLSLQSAEEEIQAVENAAKQGVFYMTGEAEVVARKESGLLKKFVVNYVYDFLTKNLRQGHKPLVIPRSRLLKVAMVYEI